MLLFLRLTLYSLSLLPLRLEVVQSGILKHLIKSGLLGSVSLVLVLDRDGGYCLLVEVVVVVFLLLLEDLLLCFFLVDHLLELLSESEGNTCRGVGV